MSHHPPPIARDNLSELGRLVVVSKGSHEIGTSPPGRAVTHSYAALAFYLGGRSRMQLKGEWKLAAGDVLILPAGEPHRMLETDEPSYWGMAFCVPCVAADGASTLLEPFERVREGGAAVVQIPVERRAYLERLFEELEAIGRDPSGPGDAIEAIQRSLLTLVLAEVDRAWRSSPERTGAGGGVAVEALRFIERNCLRPLTLKEVAAAVGRSPTYVTAALTRATGRSAVQWIVAGRMAEARRLLLHSDEMIDVIAERVGYADSTHFIRMFRRTHGITPAAWRAAQAPATR